MWFPSYDLGPGGSILLSIFVASGVSLLVSLVAAWVFTRTILARVYSLECDVADLQDRHLRVVRKAAADKRWSGEDAIDQSLSDAVAEVQTAKPKGWAKWGSSKSSS